MESGSLKLVPKRASKEVAQERLPEYYVEAETSLVERAFRNLKHGDAFSVVDSFGDMGTISGSPEGLFFRDTRYLSHHELRVEGRRPLLLGSVLEEDNASLSVDLTNPDFHAGEKIWLPRDTIFIERAKFLWQGTCYERIGLRNYDLVRRTLRIDVLSDADFADLFEVRGTPRHGRGRQSARLVDENKVEFQYEGLDGVTRVTRLTFNPAPLKLEPYRASFEVTLDAGGHTSLFITVTCQEGAPQETYDFFLAYRDRRRAIRSIMSDTAHIEGSNELFNEVAGRAISDLYTLATVTEHGLYPYAGIPWYSTVFGRDGIITAMMVLWLDPAIAKGVLRYLAATQATHEDPEADAQPGKILHERRLGEMARLGEVPFRLYYGTVDATPLFVMLAGMYYERTGDLETIEAIWPNINAALRWIDQYGDRDGDGFIEYFRETEHGLANQGWKDSHDSIFHADGSLAEGPIALCEVQGYVYAAKKYAAKLLEKLGSADAAARLTQQADDLQRRFEEVFWCEDLGTYALALDGAKRPCRVRTSNAGHALFAGIASNDRAERVAHTLLGRDSFSGWGIRTVAKGEARYNPMSYHNGSIWPHDNALIALGLARYGYKKEAAKVFDAIFDAATYQEMRRLPELFCGFNRSVHRGPTAYPVACAPQAWASAAPFAFLSACLGLQLSYERNQIRYMDPLLPDFLQDVTIRNLKLGEAVIDVRSQRHGDDVTTSVLSRQGDVRLMAMK
jgi:glycogen debranching enzyme